MQSENMIQMVNRIGEFFDALPDRNEARKSVADHLHKYWEPHMRHELYAHVDKGGEGLKPLVLEALRAHRTELIG